MNDPSLEIVRVALAIHLDVEPEAISEHHELTGDLGLDPLDLVLVVLRLEELASADLPIAELEHASTVADLVDLVRGWREDSGIFLATPSAAFRPASNDR